jgi:hypothetical protein
MKFVYVLEEETRFQQEIVQAVLEIDPKIQVRFFSKLESFRDWLRVAMTEGAAAISKGGFPFPGVVQEEVVEEAHQLVLVVSKIEILGAKQIDLLRKTRKLFIERNICTKEDPTSVVLTAFDDPHFNSVELRDPIINNIIFKPFDRLILLQDLTFAIDGRHPPSKYTIQNQKSSSVIEILKGVSLEAISETGFLTRSDRPIPPGQVSKYYAKHFVTERHRSMIGVCEASEDHPTILGQHLARIRFFSAEPAQISNIRKKARAQEGQVFAVPQISVPPITEADVVIVDPDEASSSGIGSSLERRFTGLKITQYDSFADFFYDLDPSQMTSQKDLPKAFGGIADATIEVDAATGAVRGVAQTTGAPVLKVFGFAEADWKDKSNWLAKMLDAKGQEKWRRMLTAQGLQSTDDPYFNFRVGENTFLVKFVLRDKKQNGNWLLKFEDTKKEDLLAYLTKNSRLPAKPLAVLFSHRFLGESPVERWNLISELFKKRSAAPKLIMLSAQDYTDAQEREMAAYLTDIFFKPIDRSYLVCKFHLFFPGLKIIGDPIDHRYIINQELLKVANPVKITEFSEAGFIMEYGRAIEIGSFREVVLWQPYEVGAPELMATCNYCEEVQGSKGSFLNHFVLFGMHDLFLKSIRVWIRNNYILSKEKS